MQLELQRKVRIFLSSPAWTEFEDVHVQDLYYKLIVAQGISITGNVGCDRLWRTITTCPVVAKDPIGLDSSFPIDISRPGLTKV